MESCGFYFSKEHKFVIFHPVKRQIFGDFPYDRIVPSGDWLLKINLGPFDHFPSSRKVATVAGSLKSSQWDTLQKGMTYTILRNK